MPFPGLITGHFSCPVKRPNVAHEKAGGPQIFGLIERGGYEKFKIKRFDFSSLSVDCAGQGSGEQYRTTV